MPMSINRSASFCALHPTVTMKQAGGRARPVPARSRGLLGVGPGRLLQGERGVNNASRVLRVLSLR
eukprot:10896979-Alexandrium_andersonii.AAC.1